MSGRSFALYFGAPTITETDADNRNYGDGALNWPVAPLQTSCRTSSLSRARLTDLRAKTNFLSQINVIWVVQSSSKKYSAFQKQKSVLYLSPSRPTRGALRNVINAGRDAVDADGALRRGCRTRTAKACGPDTPTLVSSSWRQLHGRRWQKSPVAGESAI